MMTRRAFVLLLGPALLLFLTGCSATRTRESTGEYFDDSAVTTRVKAALLKEPSLSSFDIEVETFKGKVQLSGFVNTKDEAATAGRVAAAAKGVKSVVNSLVVK